MDHYRSRSKVTTYRIWEEIVVGWSQVEDKGDHNCARWMRGMKMEGWILGHDLVGMIANGWIDHTNKKGLSQTLTIARIDDQTQEERKTITNTERKLSF